MCYPPGYHLPLTPLTDGRRRLAVRLDRNALVLATRTEKHIQLPYEAVYFARHGSYRHKLGIPTIALVLS